MFNGNSKPIPLKCPFCSQRRFSARALYYHLYHECDTKGDGQACYAYVGLVLRSDAEHFLNNDDKHFVKKSNEITGFK